MFFFFFKNQELVILESRIGIEYAVQYPPKKSERRLVYFLVDQSIFLVDVSTYCLLLKDLSTNYLLLGRLVYFLVDKSTTAFGFFWRILYMVLIHKFITQLVGRCRQKLSLLLNKGHVPYLNLGPFCSQWIPYLKSFRALEWITTNQLV